MKCEWDCCDDDTSITDKFATDVGVIVPPGVVSDKDP